MLVRSQHRAEPGLHAVADDRQRTVVQQVRDVPPVADIDLFVGVEDGGVGFAGILEFDDAERNAVDIEQHIGAAVLALTVVHIIDRELVHYPESVILGMLEVDETDHVRSAILRGELNAVHQHGVDVVQRGELAFRSGEPNSVDQFRNLVRDEKRMRCGNEGVNIFGDQHVHPAGARNIVAEGVHPACILEHPDDRVFEILLAESAVVIHECHIIPLMPSAPPSGSAPDKDFSSDLAHRRQCVSQTPCNDIHQR